MKVRIHANSIRFRLKENETGLLSQREKISEVLEIGTEKDRLTFTLQVAGESNFSCKQENNNFIFFLPRHVVSLWLKNNDAGFSQVIDAGSGRQLKLIVEKDFPCSHQDKQEKTSGIQFH